MEQFKSMLKIFKNKLFFFLNCKNKHKKGNFEKAKKEQVVALTPKNIDDRKLNLRKTTKIPTEYREKAIRYFEN